MSNIHVTASDTNGVLQILGIVFWSVYQESIYFV